MQHEGKPGEMDCDTTHNADDLVTDEMVTMAVGLLFGGPRRAEDYQAVRAILRAVAPMIAARAAEHFDCSWVTGHAVAAEREAIARFAEQWMEQRAFWPSHAEALAAAIRARGET
jgi:hypothetical protein